MKCILACARAFEVLYMNYCESFSYHCCRANFITCKEIITLSVFSFGSAAATAVTSAALCPTSLRR